jgi:hypothetical protein
LSAEIIHWPSLDQSRAGLLRGLFSRRIDK